MYTIQEDWMWDEDPESTLEHHRELMESFLWSRSPQGHDYWLMVFEKGWTEESKENFKAIFNMDTTPVKEIEWI